MATMKADGRRRFQFSLRSLLLVSAVAAVLLLPVAWVTRERQAALRAAGAVASTRGSARAVIRAERDARVLRAAGTR